MRYLLIILTFLLTNYLNAQEVTKGLILPDEGFDVCCFYIPNSGLTIYNQPNGTVAGKLTLGKPDNNKEIYSATIQVDGKIEDFGYPN